MKSHLNILIHSIKYSYLLTVALLLFISLSATVEAAPVNLISNPSLEVASSDPTLPQGWVKGGWGTNTRIFTYPAIGYDGAKAAKVEITSYTNGDAKWYFNEVPATPGQTYTFSNNYISNVPSFISVRFKMTNGTFTYLDLPQAPTSPSSWKNIQGTFTVPTNVTSMTVFHVIKQVGYLTTDNFSLVSTTTTTPPLPPTSVNLIPNPTFETLGANGDPVGWFRGGNGNNTRTFVFGDCEPSYTYADILYPSNYYAFVYRPPCPPNMKYGLTVETSDYVDGDAKWYFTDVPIGSNKKFKLAYRYRNSTESAQIVARYAFPNGSYQFVQIKKLPIHEGGMGHVYWSYAEDRFIAPQGAISLTLFFAITNGSPRPYPDLQFTSPDLRVDDGSVWGNDLPAPGVSITSHTSGQVVAGTINVSASVMNGANVVAAGLFVNNQPGIAIGPVDTTTPYSFTWDTKSVPDGEYTINVTVIENWGMGRQTSSQSLPLRVNNTLVQNSSFETRDPAGNPTVWTKGGWGNNTRQHSVENIIPYPSGSNCYPTIYRLADGVRVGRVQVDNYVDGDAKWVFKDVIIGSEKIYTLQHVYRQGPYTTELTARYLMNDGSYKYVKLADLQGRTGGGNCSGADLMQQVSHSFVVANDAKSMTVYQTLHSNGYIEIDNFDLRLGGIAIQSPLAGSILANTVPISLAVQGAQDIQSVIFQVDGVDVSPEDTTAPYSFAWDSKTVPNGNHNISAKITQSSFALVDTASVSVNVSNVASPPVPPSDATVPTASVTSPNVGATLSGNTTVSITASDNVAVAGVTLLVDGSVLGIEDTVAPYEFAWNTASATNTSHTLTARARDTSGNFGTSTPVTVTVSNVVQPPPPPPTPTSTNLISNPSFETLGTGGDPGNWIRKVWGTNVSTFTYPSVGADGNKASKIQITSYTNGDAKWRFNDVTVVGGKTYSFKSSYKSTATTELGAWYQTSASKQYQVLATLPASPTWTTVTRHITVPINATALSVTQAIYSIGILEVDDFSLTLVN